MVDDEKTGGEEDRDGGCMRRFLSCHMGGLDKSIIQQETSVHISRRSGKAIETRVGDDIPQQGVNQDQLCHNDC